MGRFGKYPGLGWDKVKPLGMHHPTQKALQFSRSCVSTCELGQEE